MSLLRLTRVGVFAVAALLSLHASASDRSFVGSADAPNKVLLVGVSHGLPGIDIDVNNLKRISAHSSYNFQATTLMDSAGTISGVSKELTRLSTASGTDGALLFYYSGHGSPGSIYVQDGSLEVAKIRKAIEDGRKNLSPLERLLFISDSCYSGTLLDPMRLGLLNELRDPAILSVLTANEITFELSRSDEPGRAATYWNKLFVFASSRADETSLAGKDGSVFTNAFAKAFDETASSHGTMAELVKKSQDYTKGHHPVARFAPADFDKEDLIR